MKRITQWVHDGLLRHLRAGDWVVDATLGNGHDAEFLLNCVAPGGRVFGFDVQPQAIQQSTARIGGAAGFTAMLADHSLMQEHLPREAQGHLRAVVFNLGYLPRGDRAVVTTQATTLAALELALSWLAAGGVLSCTCYPGTPAGQVEATAVENWFGARDTALVAVTRIESVATLATGPFTLWLEKR